MSVVGSSEPWKPWANDPEFFERAVLADLERRVSKPIAGDPMREPAGRVFRETRLDGSYPKTAIVVRLPEPPHRERRGAAVPSVGRRRAIAQARV